MLPCVPFNPNAVLFPISNVIIEQLVKVNKRGCAELAERSANAARSIRSAVRGRESLIDETMKMAIEQLHKYVMVSVHPYVFNLSLCSTVT